MKRIKEMLLVMVIAVLMLTNCEQEGLNIPDIEQNRLESGTNGLIKTGKI